MAPEYNANENKKIFIHSALIILLAIIVFLISWGALFAFKNYSFLIVLTLHILTFTGVIIVYVSITKKKNLYLSNMGKVNKSIEEELAAKEKKFRILFETMAEGVVYQDADGKIIDTNPAAQKMLGLSKEELTGRYSNDERWLSVYEDGSEYKGEDHPSMTALKTGKPVFNKIMGVYNPQLNKQTWLIINANPQFVEGSEKPAHVYATISDITELKKAKEEYYTSQQKYKSLFDNMVDAFALHRVIYDENGSPCNFTFLEINHAYEIMIGRKSEEVIGKNLSDIMPEIDLVCLRKFADVAVTGQAIRFEKYYPEFDKYFDIKVFTHKKGEFAALFSDITTQKKNEEALKESELHFHNLADSGQVLIWTSKVDKNCDYFNKSWLDFTGRSLEQEMGDGWTAGLHPEDKDFCINTYVNAFDKREHFSMAYRMKRKDGEYRWIQDDGSPRYNSKNEFIGYIGHCLDITDRKYFEEKIETANEELRIINKIISISTGAINIKDMFDIILDEILLLVGIEGGTICQIEPDNTFKLISERGASAETIEDLATNRIPVGECLCGNCVQDNCPLILYDRDDVLKFSSREVLRGELINFHAAFPVKTKEQCVGVICVFTRTEKKPTARSLKMIETITSHIALAIENIQLFEKVKQNVIDLESRVQQRTKQFETANKELEAFSYSVSHDLRAPLRAISGFTSILMDNIKESLDEENLELIKDILKNADSMKHLIDDLLKFSRLSKKEITKIPVDIEIIFKNVFSELLEVSGRTNIEFNISQLPDAWGDYSLLRQVVTNLLSNAIKYTGKELHAIITVEGEETETEVIYMVKDNGVGFDMKFVEKIFGVFQRLHSAAEFEGSGVGLALVKRIIDRHDGRIWVEAKDKEGAAFYFALPKEIKDPGEIF